MSLYTGLQLPSDQKLAGLIVMSGMPHMDPVMHLHLFIAVLQKFVYVFT